MSRRVDYYLTLLPRHAQYLEAAPPRAVGAGDAGSIVRTMVPRDSVAMPVNIRATARPSPPNIAFPLLAFHWTYSDGGVEPIDDPRNYFRGLKTGTLTLTRTEAIRVYLRRPWHQSGAETLGVVVYPLAGEAIPGQFRDIVSRWGFDPIWNERTLPPLGLNHFPRAIDDVAHETLSPPTANVAALARLALHVVHYDPVKNLWYADVVVDMKDVGRPVGAHPFIRLNLVAHQKYALPGHQSSAIVATDLIPITGERSLRVTRSQPGRFDFVLSGNFAPNPPRVTDFPRRQVIVELQHRDPALPDDVEVLVKPNERFVRDRHALQTVTLAWCEAEQTYRGELTLPSATIARLRADSGTQNPNTHDPTRMPEAHFAIVLKEEEFYRTLSAQPSATGDRTVIFNNVACAVRTLTSVTFLL